MSTTVEPETDHASLDAACDAALVAPLPSAADLILAELRAERED